MSNPGIYLIKFGRWGKEHPGGIAIKDMKHSDVQWIAEKCTAMTEARDAARQYIEENPKLFPKKEKSRRGFNTRGKMLGGRRESWDKRR